MKKIFATSATLAGVLWLAGCGGSGASSVLSRQTAQEAVRDALGAGSQARNSRRPPAALGSDENGIIRYQVGDPYPISSDLFGRITAFSTFVFDGTERIGTFSYDIFSDPDFTRNAGSWSLSILEDETQFSSDFEQILNENAPSPQTSRTRYRLNKTTASTDFSFFRAQRVTDDPTGTPPYFSEVSTRWTSEGVERTGSYAFSEKRDGRIKSESTGRFFPDGRFEVSWLNGRGYTVATVFQSDGAGTFTVTNPADPLCPVTGTFNAEGIGTATFADGSTAEFNQAEQQFWQ